jgi:hypothetical protein
MTAFDRQAAKQELDKLLQRAEHLRHIIDAPDIPPSQLVSKPTPGTQMQYYSLGSASSADGYALEVQTFSAHSYYAAFYNHGNLFTDKRVAEAYKQAFSTLLELHHQPGAARITNQDQWRLQMRNSAANGVVIDKAYDQGYKCTNLGPWFSTKEAAQLALDTIGTERLCVMFSVLAGNV